MSKLDFQALSIQLLAGGIAPRHARRLVREVAEHYDDLRGAHGDSEAVRRIGSTDEIVRDALQRTSLKSWGARWPLAVYGAGPAVMMLAIPFAFFFVLLGVLLPVGTSMGLIPKITDPTVMHTNPTEIFVFNTLCFFFSHLFVPCLGVVFGLIALRQRMWSPWVARGIVALCVFGSFFGMGVDWPTVPGKGPELWVNIVDGGRITAMDAFLHALFNFALMSPVLVALRRAESHSHSV